MAEKRFVCAIDQGTTSTRCMIFNKEGNVVSVGQKEHNQIFPAPGLVEHDGEEIWENTQHVIKECLAKGNINPEEIASIGITNQRETTILWDKRDGHIFGNAIVWQDTRTEKKCVELKKRNLEKSTRKMTGLPISPYFSATKISWILDNIPRVEFEARKGRVLFGTMDTWVIWNLTGGLEGGIHVTDPTNASRTMLMNIQTLQWEKRLLKLFDIPESLLPKIRSSSEIIGYTKKDGPFGAEIPIAGILGDQQAALFGQTCFEEGSAKNTYGTGCFMLMNTGTRLVRSKEGLITTVAYKIGKEKHVYALEGSVAIAGALVQWIRDNIGIINTSSEIDTLASTVQDNGDVYFVPAFSGLFAPYWRGDARGVITGLTRYANKGHLARAVLESTAFQTDEIFEAMEKEARQKIKELKVDGGMVKSNLLMQFQADILDKPVIIPKVTETTALGAAYAAGLAVEFWKDKEELKLHWKEETRFIPKMSLPERKKLKNQWKRAISKSIGWL